MKKSETNMLKVAMVRTAGPVKEKIAFCYYRLAKASQAYCRMQRRASGSGLGLDVLHTVKPALSWLFEKIKEYIPQSPVPSGLIKVPLIGELPFLLSQKSGRLALWKDIHFFTLQLTETQSRLISQSKDCTLTTKEVDIIECNKIPFAFWFLF